MAISGLGSCILGEMLAEYDNKVKFLLTNSQCNAKIFNIIKMKYMRANGSVVEHRLARARAASSNLVSRFYRSSLWLELFSFYHL